MCSPLAAELSYELRACAEVMEALVALPCVIRGAALSIAGLLGEGQFGAVYRGHYTPYAAPSVFSTESCDFSDRTQTVSASSGTQGVACKRPSVMRMMRVSGDSGDASDEDSTSDTAEGNAPLELMRTAEEAPPASAEVTLASAPVRKRRRSVVFTRSLLARTTLPADGAGQNAEQDAEDEGKATQCCLLSDGSTSSSFSADGSDNAECDGELHADLWNGARQSQEVAIKVQLSEEVTLEGLEDFVQVLC